MEFKTTARRDDLVSATYMLLTLLNGNKFPIIQKAIDDSYKLTGKE